MMWGFPGMMYGGLPFFSFFGWFFFWIVLIWTMVWKGLALWRAAQRNESYWFIALLVINTLGILEILYLYIFSVDRPNGRKKRHSASAE